MCDFYDRGDDDYKSCYSEVKVVVVLFLNGRWDCCKCIVEFFKK